MATRTRPRLSTEPDPFALDSTSEGFFAVGDRPTPVVEKIELELEEEDTEFARRSSPEVVMRRRRYRRLVTRVVSGVGVVAMAAFAKGALRPADASALRPPPNAPQLAQQTEPAPLPEAPVAQASPPQETTVAVEPAPIVEPAPAPVAKVAVRAAKRDDDFSDLDVKIEVPKIDTSLDL